MSCVKWGPYDQRGYGIGQLPDLYTGVKMVEYIVIFKCAVTIVVKIHANLKHVKKYRRKNARQKHTHQLTTQNVTSNNQNNIFFLIKLYY